MNRYKLRFFLSFLVLFFCFRQGEAQESTLTYSVPLPYKLYVLNGTDTIPVFTLPTAYIFDVYRFKSKKQEQQYTKLVRDVKRTLPYAKIVYTTLIETYEYMETLPDEKSKQAHLKRMEKELYREYKPQLKKLSFSQGKLLIKLIDRECNQSSYHILNAYLGSFRAGFWNIFAGLFGASLKTEYDPENKDRQIEMIARLVEEGLI